MNRILRLALVSVVMITLLGMFASPALANTKVESYYEFADIWQPYTCANGQKIVEDYAFFVNVKTFYDNNGEFFMMEESVTQTGKIYLEDEPWKVINYENEHWKNMLKPTGVYMSPGIIMKVTSPGMAWCSRILAGSYLSLTKQRASGCQSGWPGTTSSLTPNSTRSTSTTLQPAIT